MPFLESPGPARMNVKRKLMPNIFIVGFGTEAIDLPG